MTTARSQHASAPSDSDDDFIFEELSLEEEDLGLAYGDGDPESVQSRPRATARPEDPGNPHHSEAVDVFFRNFLHQMGMSQTLECFQSEWPEAVQRGQVDPGRVGAVPDILVDIQRLDMDLRSARQERDECRREASAAADRLLSVRGARDQHQLLHKRVVQERNELIDEVRKLQGQRDGHEGALKRMDDKYRTILRQIHDL